MIFDTLIEQATEEEVVAVLGHELGHWKMNHTLKFLVRKTKKKFDCIYDV